MVMVKHTFEFRAVIFDMDGVLYLGHRAVPGVPEAIAKLRANGVRVFFLTNNATRSRATLVRKLAKMGIKARKNEIDTSAYAAAKYISSKKPGARVFVFGERGLKDEIRSAGLRIVGAGKKCDYLVTGLDRHATYGKLSDALHQLQKGVKWVCCNFDPTLPESNGRHMPGSGALASALTYASSRKPDIVVGKPNPQIIMPILAESAKLRIKKSEIALVGDRLEIDIALANAAGITPILVLTGVANAKDAKMAKGKLKPGMVLKSAADLPQLRSL
jgi:phosphoglycolate/pyridoxal phosphate phosphatase family enzyme